MKFIALLAILLAGTCIAAHADDPLQLHEWLLLKGYSNAQSKLGPGRHFSYVPKFGGPNGRNAFFVEYNDYLKATNRTQMWYLTSPSDTISHWTFSADFANTNTPMELNGDGILDYICQYGYVYLGSKDGFPDTSKVYKLNYYPAVRAGSVHYVYGKFLGDSIDNCVSYATADYSSKTLLRFVWGGSTFPNLRTTALQSPYVIDSTKVELAIVLYQNHEGKWRLLTSTWAGKESGFPNIHKLRMIPEESSLRLYAVDFSRAADSTSVILNLIDTYKDPEWLWYTYGLFYYPPLSSSYAGLMLNEPKRKEILYYCYLRTAPSDNGDPGQHYVSTFDLSKDKIDWKVNGADLYVAGGHLLAESPCGDSLTYYAVPEGSDAFGVYFFPDGSYFPKKRFYYRLSKPTLTNVSDIQSVGDMNGDGISDIGVFFDGGLSASTFAILKGTDATSAVDQIDSTTADFVLHSPYPTPTVKGAVIVPANIITSGLYTLTLYSADLATKTELWSGQLQQGRVELPIQTSPISSGTYLLRLSNGRTMAQTRIVITK